MLTLNSQSSCILNTFRLLYSRAALPKIHCCEYKPSNVGLDVDATSHSMV